MGKIVTLDLTDAQLATLAAAIGTCSLMCLSAHLPPHKLLARKLKALEEAIIDLAKLGGGVLPENVVNAGGYGWVAAVDKIAEIMERANENM